MTQDEIDAKEKLVFTLNISTDLANWQEVHLYYKIYKVKQSTTKKNLRIAKSSTQLRDGMYIVRQRSHGYAGEAGARMGPPLRIRSDRI